jgi:small subunit ribosomal protein S18
MLAFQAYVRERLAKMEEQMYPSGRTTRAKAELAWLEEQVAEDEMNKNRRRLRDPLIDVDKSEITHTNLPLLNRFVSDNGSILPSKLTGVKMIKQRRLAKAIKRAQQLALMPKIWKLPQYRHATYADDLSRPENPRPPENDDEDFREPADLRYPGQLESAEPSLGLDLAWIAKTK